MAWVKYNKYIKSLKDASIEEIDTRVHEYFDDIKCKRPESCFHASVKKMFETKTTLKNGIKALRDLYPVYVKLFPKMSTRRRYLSQVRKVIQNSDSPEELYNVSKNDDVFNLDKGERLSLIDDYKEKIKNKNRNKIQIDVKEIESAIVDLSLSNNFYDKVLLLLLTTGSRPVGILVKNNIQLGPDNTLLISGLAKKRGDNKDLQVERPVLFITNKIALKKFKEVRAYIKRNNLVMINKDGELSKDKNNTLNKRAIQVFPFLKDHKSKSSLLRKVYADLSYKQYADKSRMNFNNYIQSTLGHDDILTSFSYSYLNVDDSNKTNNVSQLNQQIRDLQIKYQTLINRCCDEEQKYEKEFKTQKPKNKAEENELLEKLYNENSKITVRELQKKAHISTNKSMLFLRGKRK